ncbi:MAG: hypothetical protein M3P49_13035 [Actinomycetota bacterium]|nr:hypothetical protein [Actinomycetota bacterium]
MTLSDKFLLEMQRRMVRIRLFDEREEDVTRYSYGPSRIMESVAEILT